jgi:hypothetical protein
MTEHAAKKPPERSSISEIFQAGAREHESPPKTRHHGEQIRGKAPNANLRRR